MGRLFVVPTPIGNLEDITMRALDVLRRVDLVLAEDTRRTRGLFQRYEIQTPLRSYHQHNKVSRLEDVLDELQEHEVALVSDAGMPSLADPGFELISAAVARGIEVDVLPGASAIVTAVVTAALPAPGFLFLGFLPRRSTDRRRRLTELATLPYTIVCFEAPHRLVASLKDIGAVLGKRQMVVAREMTKMHQEVVRGTPNYLAGQFESQGARGEITLVIAGCEGVIEDRTVEALDDLRSRRERGEDRRTAMRHVAGQFGVSRHILYDAWESGRREDSSGTP